MTSTLLKTFLDRHVVPQTINEGVNVAVHMDHSSFVSDVKFHVMNVVTDVVTVSNCLYCSVCSMWCPLTN
jgi:hypothetical protein